MLEYAEALLTRLPVSFGRGRSPEQILRENNRVLIPLRRVAHRVLCLLGVKMGMQKVEGRRKVLPPDTGHQANTTVADAGTERSAPLSLAAIARRLKIEKRTERAYLEHNYDQRKVTARKWTIRVDTLDVATRRKVESR